jgi:putative membrane-bound dehydrogenase-like protein
MRWGFLSILAVLGGWAPRVYTAELPTPPAGWKLEVVARAPVVRHPSVVCCAPDGRVFVAEDPMDIRLPSADAAAGRIVCIHPDGRVTNFADNLHAVFGMQYLEGRLYVLHNPRFTAFVDGGDMGRDPRDLIACTNPNPWALNWNDHVPANFKLAMDGYFYVAVGDKGLYGATGTDGRRLDLRGGGVVRIRPDGSGLEAFCTGVRNILDVAINDEDEVFTYDNTDEHDWMGRLTHMVDGGLYGYPYDFAPRRPYTLWMMADYGAGAATGTACYTDDALPAEYRGNLFLADFGKRNVLRVRVAREGATYKALSRQDLFTDVPADFRPVGICFSPDGASLYLCDWQHVDTKEDVEVGRLLKLTYTGKTDATPKPQWYVPAATGKQFRATVADLVAALSHPSRDVRLVAQRRLGERNDAPEAVRGFVDDPTRPPLARAHALWALNSIDGSGTGRPAWRQVAAGDASPLLRRQALRQLGERRDATALSVMQNRLQDDDPSVRFQAATGIGRVGNPTAVTALVETLADTDDWVRFAAFTALNRIARDHPAVWEQVAGALRVADERVRQGAAFGLRDTYDVALVVSVANVTTDRNASATARAAALRVLGPLHRKPPEWKGEWWAYHPALGARPRKSVAWDGTTRVLGALRSALNQREREVKLAALAGLEDAADPDAAEAIRDAFERGQDEAVRRQALSALAACDDGKTPRYLMNHLGDPARDRRFDADALRTLGRLKAQIAAPVMAGFARQPVESLRSAAFEALVRTGGESAAAAVVDLLRDGAPDVRVAAVRAAGELGDRSAIPPLLEAYGRRETRETALAALAQIPDARAAGVYLDGVASGDFAIREKCKSSLREVRDAALPAVEAWAATAPPDDALLEVRRVYEDHAMAKAGSLFRTKVQRKHPSEFVDFAVSHSGDAAAGRKLFGDSRAGGVGCRTCHAAEGAGGTVGPDLSGVGAKYSRRDLAEAIAFPSKAVREGYQQVVVRMRNGQTYAGPVKAETPDTLTLQEADGTLRPISKGDVVARKDSGLSPMPEGLCSGLTEQQFADLVSYLESLKTEPSPASGGKGL